MNEIITFTSSISSQHHSRRILFDIRYIKSKKAKPVIIFIHGFKGFKDWGPFNLVADFFAQQEFVFCKLNLSHNGTTQDSPDNFDDLEAFGHNNFSIELNDIGTMIDYFFSESKNLPHDEINLKYIFLLGHSRGGGMALLKAFEDKRIKAVATLAAISDLKERWSQTYLEEWKQNGVQYVYNGRTKQNMPLYYQLIEDLNVNSQRLNIPDAVKQLDKPALIIHGTEDETLPVSMAKTIKEWNPSTTLRIVEGAGHTFGGYHPYTVITLPEALLVVVQEISAFFKKVR